MNKKKKLLKSVQEYKEKEKVNKIKKKNKTKKQGNGTIKVSFPY